MTTEKKPDAAKESRNTITVPEIKRGAYLIIRVNGHEEDIPHKPTIGQIQKDIGCDWVDTVLLDHNRQIIMVVDDSGMIDGKPVNQKATALYLTSCRPGTPYSIHGDVAIVNDEDFA
jgi:hypothetical protein